LLQDIPPARLFEETLKLFQAGHALQTYQLLREYDLFAPLFPQVATLLTREGNSPFERFSRLALRNTDERVAQDLPVSRPSSTPPCCGRGEKRDAALCQRELLAAPGPCCWP
jgi:tRNA nucleotidyltransferase/poly(A) polymerase